MCARMSACLPSWLRNGAMGVLDQYDLTWSTPCSAPSRWVSARPSAVAAGESTVPLGALARTTKFGAATPKSSSSACRARSDSAPGSA